MQGVSGKVISLDSLPELVRILGKKTGNKLGELGLESVEDLLHHYPRRYVPRGELTPLHHGEEGEYLTYVARLKKKEQRRVKNNTLTLTALVFTDGQTDVTCAFFSKSPFTVNKVVRNLKVGDTAVVTGKVGVRWPRGRALGPQRELIHPDVTELEDPIDPAVDPEGARAQAEQPLVVYPTANKIRNNFIADAVKTVLGPMQPGDIPDPIPESVRERYGLLPLLDALRELHLPRSLESAELARETMRFHEAFVLQAALARRRLWADSFEAVPRAHVDGGLLDQLDASLPFKLTEGQQAVGAEIREDLASDRPMQRLLQGEVGSGKTVVALRAMLQVIDAGGQAALLAPTEVLAGQHARSIENLLGALAGKVRVTLLTGSLSAAQRRHAMLDAASGKAGIVVGTHALLNENVQFAELGLVVVDEQHRFGVEQRDVLRAKAEKAPHYLVMTATPIPRSVAMTVFGDVDTSTLRELPAGRADVQTFIVDERNTAWVERVWERVAEEVDKGGRAYIVCPRIGDDVDDAGEGVLLTDDDEEAGQEQRPLTSVTELAQKLAGLPALAGKGMRVMHGRLSPEEKDAAMADFAEGRAPILISTTVIEVGVDVPEAAVMVIMDGHMFGMSQLHQLRGRIGRGSREGICLVVTPSRSKTAVKRLTAFAATRDGFELAELDLSLRREGDVLGRAQSGTTSSLKFLRVISDAAVIEQAREAAWATLDEDPDLLENPALADAVARVADQEDYLDRA